jgi:hypothetical protein
MIASFHGSLLLLRNQRFGKRAQSFDTPEHAAVVQRESGIRSNTNAKEKNPNASKIDFGRLVGKADYQSSSGET